MLLNCWLGHLTLKIVPDMTYNVFGGTLNPTLLLLYQRLLTLLLVSLLLICADSTNCQRLLTLLITDIEQWTQMLLISGGMFGDN